MVHAYVTIEINLHSYIVFLRTKKLSIVSKYLLQIYFPPSLNLAQPSRLGGKNELLLICSTKIITHHAIPHGNHLVLALLDPFSGFLCY